MNYKAEIRPYESQEELDEQLAVLVESWMYETIDDIAYEYGLSKGKVIRTLLDYAIKHVTIDAPVKKCCGTCAHYFADDYGDYVCCNPKSEHAGDFRLRDFVCDAHQGGGE